MRLQPFPCQFQFNLHGGRDVFGLDYQIGMLYARLGYTSKELDIEEDQMMVYIKGYGLEMAKMKMESKAAELYDEFFQRVVDGRITGW